MWWTDNPKLRDSRQISQNCLKFKLSQNPPYCLPAVIFSAFYALNKL